MNPGLFGISKVSGVSSTTGLRLRNPFDVDEQNKNGIRVWQTPIHFVSYIQNSSTMNIRGLASNGVAVVGTGALNSTGTSYSATTNAPYTTDGKTWTNATVTSGQYNPPAWTGTKFIAQVNASTTSIQSTNNGATWGAGPTLPSTAIIKFIRHKGKLFGFPATGTTYYEFTTEDATASTTRAAVANYAAPLQSTNTFSYLIYSTGENIIVVTSSTAGIYSSDGLTWTTFSFSLGSGTSHTAATIGGNSNMTIIFGDVNSSICYIVSYDHGLTWSVPIPLVFKNSSFTYPSTVPALGGVKAFPFAAGSAPFCCLDTLGSRMFVTFATSESTNYYQFVAHTIDGMNWDLEDPLVSHSGHIASYASLGDRMVFVSHGDIQATTGNNTYRYVTHTLFKELIYDL